MELLNSITPNNYKYFMKTQKRGPDRSTFEYLGEPNNIYIGFHRLSIMDPSTRGDQPFKLEYNNRTIFVICNGEIYNYRELSTKYNIELSSGSDCEVIGYLYKQIGIYRLCKELNGEYAFIILDIDMRTGHGDVYACRDRFGIRPMFISDNNDTITFSSEMKSIKNKKHIKVVEPRKYLHYIKNSDTDNKWKNNNYTEYYTINNPKLSDFITLDTCELSTIKKLIRESFIESVKCRLASDRPLGCLLSGGLDSSLVASIAARELKKHGRVLRTFSIGLEDSTDEYYARLVAEHIGSEHTHIKLEQEDFIKAIQEGEVIYATETYDITTVRASTGQYLISKWISENTDIKVLLIGDGSDELAAGYMYFHNAPSSLELHDDNIRLLTDIHYYDVLRADRGVAGNGLEARVPFLDYRFVDLYLSIHPDLRHPKKYDKYPLEKWLLREAFNIDDYLPDRVLFRKKEAFSDGVSSMKKSWYMIIQEHVDKLYSDEEFAIKQNNIKHNTPVSKEALYFRDIWRSLFGYDEETAHVIPYFWLPKWCGDIKEPSARVLDVYK